MKCVIKTNADKQVKLEKQAEENTTTSLKRAKEEPKTLKQGTPPDHALKHEPKQSAGDLPFERKVGMSKGITKNMDNYESFRVDCWLVDTVLLDETQEEALDRISEVIDKQIQKEVEAILE